VAQRIKGVSGQATQDSSSRGAMKRQERDRAAGRTAIKERQVSDAGAFGPRGPRFKNGNSMRRGIPPARVYPLPVAATVLPANPLCDFSCRHDLVSCPCVAPAAPTCFQLPPRVSSCPPHLSAQMLLDGDGVVSAALDGGVIGHDHHLLAAGADRQRAEGMSRGQISRGQKARAVNGGWRMERAAVTSKQLEHQRIPTEAEGSRRSTKELRDERLTTKQPRQLGRCCSGVA